MLTVTDGGISPISRFIYGQEVCLVVCGYLCLDSVSSFL